MGEELAAVATDPESLRAFTLALIADIDALEELIDAGRIETGVRRVGAEQEMFLVDEGWRPASKAMEVLAAIDDRRFTTELGLYNMELNLDPVPFRDTCLSDMHADLDSRLDEARRVGAELGVHVALTGILPTLRKSDLTLQNMTPRNRYRTLNEALHRLRGGQPWRLFIRGEDQVACTHDSVMLESACTSFQVHLQVGPDEFANLYNLSQAVIAPVVAAAGNSPLLFGRRLWRETRIPVFQQSLDTRRSGDHLRESAARVRFGENWIDDSILEIFREDVVRFRVILGEALAEDPFEVLDAGGVPELPALRLHNGTVYRWNRGCYGVRDGVPHLRIEMRGLPAGPTVEDEIANAALYYGLVCGLSSGEVDPTRGMSFGAARANFQAAAKRGLDARLTWLSGTQTTARKLLLEELLPVARAGLEDSGLAAADIDRYLGVIEERVRSGRTGAAWALDSFRELLERSSRQAALAAITAETVHNQKEGQPVHTWQHARPLGGTLMDLAKLRIEELMTTDVYTVGPEEPIAAVGKIMEWKSVRHLPVEDESQQLAGMLSCFEVLEHLGRRGNRGDETPAGDLMDSKPPQVAPDASLATALEIMHEEQSDYLAVVSEGELAGIVTERDFVALLARALKSSSGG